MDRRSLLGLAGAALALPRSLWAQTADPDWFRLLDPGLRGVARGILRAQSAGVAYSPPRPPPLPPGVVERQAPGGPGQPPVTLFVVDPGPPATTPRGAILHIHGGGYVGGDPRDGLRRLVALAGRLGCVIVAPAYRLAPATRFPGALEDNLAALRWLHAEAAALGVDPARIVVMGESAGGGHAAMLAIAARDRGGPGIARQLLVYPMLDDRTGSIRRAAPHLGRLVWTEAQNREGWSALLGQPAGGRRVPAGSVPARVADLAHLPPAFIAVGSLDLFVEEDIDYARRLISAGVPTELVVTPGGFHGSEMMAPAAASSRQFTAALDTALARALAPETGQ